MNSDIHAIDTEPSSSLSISDVKYGLENKINKNFDYRVTSSCVNNAKTCFIAKLRTNVRRFKKLTPAKLEVLKSEGDLLYHSLGHISPTHYESFKECRFRYK